MLSQPAQHSYNTRKKTKAVNLSAANLKQTSNIKLNMGEKKFEALLTTFLDVATQDLAAVKKTNADLTSSVADLIKENLSLREDLSQFNKRLQFQEGLIAQMRVKMAQQNEELMELKARSMRENIVVKGVAEDPGETWDQTKTKLRNFIKEQLKVKDADTAVVIDRAHRSGAPGRGPRPIIAKLLTQSSKDVIFRNTKNLGRDSPFKVQEQLPPEVSERRSKLWPKFVEAKENKDNKVRWALDKLVINGTTFTAKDDNVDFNESVNLDSPIEISHTDHVTVEGSTFMAHAAEVKSRADTATIMAKILQDKALASATHNIYAFRYRTEDRLIEGKKDDGEHGAGRQLLKLLQDRGAENIMVIVTRWFGNRHLGPKRFTCITECAETAIDNLPIA